MERDPEDRKKGGRKPSALDQIARLRQGLRDSGREGDRAPAGEAARRAARAFGDDDGGRVARPDFAPRLESREDAEARRAARRDATRIGDADPSEDGSLVRAMLRDIKPGDRAGAAPSAPRRAVDDGYDNPTEDDYGDADLRADRRDDDWDDDYDDFHRDDDPSDDGWRDEDRYEDRYAEAFDDDGYDDREDDAYPSRRADDRRGPRGRDISSEDDDWPQRDSADDRGRGRGAREAGLGVGGRFRGGGRAEASRGADPDFGEPAEDARRERRGPRRSGGGRAGGDGRDGGGRSRGPTPPPAPEEPLNVDPPSGRSPAPFGALERTIAGRYLRARRQEGFISVIAWLALIGVTLGVAVLIVVMSVMNGFRTELVSKIVGLDGHMSVRAVAADPETGALDYAPLRGYESLAADLDGVSGVVMAAPLVESPVFATGDIGDGAPGLVRGIPAADFRMIEPVALAPEDSRGLALEFGAERSVAIGWELAAALGLDIGDEITLLSPTSVSTPFGRSPRRRIFEVSYIFRAGYYEYDRGVIFMPIDEAHDFFGTEGAVDGIEIMVATPEELDGYRADFIEILRQRPGEAFVVQDWTETKGGLVGALQTEQTVMFFILSMLILIASLVIISGLIMLVKEKGAGIAILRTMGLSRGGVMRVFFMCGAVIGVVGTALGVVLGVLFALNIAQIKNAIESAFGVELFPSNIYFLSELPSRLDWGDVGFTVLLTLSISFLATLYPARKAARLDPVEGLRNG